MAKITNTKPVMHRFRINTNLIDRTLHFSIGEDKCIFKSGEYNWEMIRVVAAARLGSALKRKIYTSNSFDVLPLGPQLQPVRPKLKTKTALKKAVDQPDITFWQNKI
jgi:hypothetical protein